MNSCYIPPLRYRAKEGLRKIVREILLAMALCTITLSIVALNLASPYDTANGGFVLMGLVGGVLSGPILWALYRIARFALGR